MSDLASLFPLAAPAPLPGRRVLICSVCAEWLATGGQAPVFAGRHNVYWTERVHRALGPETDYVHVMARGRPVVQTARCATCTGLGTHNFYPAVIEGAVE